MNARNSFAGRVRDGMFSQQSKPYILSSMQSTKYIVLPMPPIWEHQQVEGDLRNLATSADFTANFVQQGVDLSPVPYDIFPQAVDNDSLVPNDPARLSAYIWDGWTHGRGAAHAKKEFEDNFGWWLRLLAPPASMPVVDADSPTVRGPAGSGRHIVKSMLTEWRNVPRYSGLRKWMMELADFITPTNVLPAITQYRSMNGGVTGVDVIDGEVTSAASKTAGSIFALHETLQKAWQKNYLALNPIQRGVVEAAVRDPLALIVGPPGTGKTHTLASIMLAQVLRTRKDTVEVRDFVLEGTQAKLQWNAQMKEAIAMAQQKFRLLSEVTMIHVLLMLLISSFIWNKLSSCEITGWTGVVRTTIE